jgi:DNA-binding MarR family transcriptional regulator
MWAHNLGGIEKKWTFLNNHALVLLCLARKPKVTLREVAEMVGITERATQLIVRDLVECKVLNRERVGRCNKYRINENQPLRHPLKEKHTVGELLATLLAD